MKYEQDIFYDNAHLSNKQKELYVFKISEAFGRMGFYIEMIEKEKLPEMYELLLFHIENPPDKYFDIFTSDNFNGIALRVERI